MALQLLLEASSGVSAMKSIESACIFDGQRMTIMILPHSVVFVNGLTGVLLRSVEFPKRDAVKIVDCSHIIGSRNFLVAFSNSTVALISEHTVSTAEIEYVAWPQQPQFLMPLDSGAIVAACTDGTVWHVSLVDGRISSPTSMWQSNEGRIDWVCVGACCSGESVSLLLRRNQTEGDREGESSSDSSSISESVQCSLLSWSVPPVESAVTISSSSSGSVSSSSSSSHSNSGSVIMLGANATLFDFKIRKNEKFINICSHAGSRSLSVVFSSPSARIDNSKNSCLIRWIKYDYSDGALLFERHLGGEIKTFNHRGQNLQNVIPVGQLLWFVFDGRAGLWDPRYGVELANTLTSLRAADPIRPPPAATAYPTVSPGNHLSCYSLVMSEPHSEGTSIFLTTLKVPTVQTSGSLCNALGQQKMPHILSSGKYFVRGHRLMMGMSKTSIMSKLSEKMQKDMRNGLTTMLYEDDQSSRAMAEERKRAEEPIEPDTFHSHSHRRHRPPQKGTNGNRAVLHETWGEKIIYLEIPAATVECYLEHFQALFHNAYPQWEDWDYMHPLVLSGTVSTSKSGPNSHLITQAIRSSRFDILAAICLYCPDLTEKAAVEILLACANAREEELVDLCVDRTGRITFMRPDPKKHNGPDKAPVGKSKRYEKLRNAYRKDLTNGQLISITMENIIRRKVSYSTILLSDLMKKQITPSFAIIMLRVVMLFLKGLCAPLMLNSNSEEAKGTDMEMDVGTNAEGAVDSSSRKKRRVQRGGSVNDLVTVFQCVSPHTGGLWNAYNDDHVQGAITWAEALLDAHFSTLAFRASLHAPTRQALGNVMETIATASDASQELERVLGLWVHVSRVIKSKGYHKTPSTALYQRETLRI